MLIELKKNSISNWKLQDNKQQNQYRNYDLQKK